MSFAAIGISLGTMGLSYGLSQLSQPNQPDLASSSKELSDTEARLLPVRRQLEALAQQGGKGTINVPGMTHTETRQVVQVGGGSGSGSGGGLNLNINEPRGRAPRLVPYVAAEWQPGGKYYQAGQAAPRIVTQQVQVPGLQVDFTGVGTADVESAVAEKMAKIQLDLSKKYDSQFIEQALAQEKLADPESFAARDKMDELIHEQINRPLNSPVADLLDQQVGDEVRAAKDGTLDAETQLILDKATEAALRSRGGTGGVTGDFETPLTTGFEGEARKQAAMQKGTGWLASGQTPEDIRYRREQQNLANLSAEATGQTPQSQFGQLKNAQQGPTPVVSGQGLSTLPGNISGTAASGALAQQEAQSNQANPWMAGMSALLNIGAAAGKAGWKPFA